MLVVGTSRMVVGLQCGHLEWGEQELREPDPDAKETSVISKIQVSVSAANMSGVSRRGSQWNLMVLIPMLKKCVISKRQSKSKRRPFTL